MREHRLSLDDSCKMCHGPIKFGNDGGSFCSNPACHGRAWPEINLNVDPPAAAAPVKAADAPKAVELAKAAPAKEAEAAKKDAKK